MSARRWEQRHDQRRKNWVRVGASKRWVLEGYTDDRGYREARGAQEGRRECEGDQGLRFARVLPADGYNRTRCKAVGLASQSLR